MATVAARRKEDWALWLPDILSDAGCDVVVTPGWEKRGKPFKEILGIAPHHTASNPKGGPAPALNLLMHGRGGTAPVPGPLSNISTGRDAKTRIVAAGAANHPGVSELILPGRTISSGVKYYMLGDEIELSGVGEPFPTSGRQYEAAHRAYAAICLYLGLDPMVAIQDHKLIARPKGRKIDVRPYDLPTGRNRVRTLIRATDPVVTPTPKPSEEEELMAAKDDIVKALNAKIDAQTAALNKKIDGAVFSLRPFPVRIGDANPYGMPQHSVWVCDAFYRRRVSSRPLLNLLYIGGLVRAPGGGPMHEPIVKAEAIADLVELAPLASA